VIAAIVLTVLPELLRDVQQYRMIIYALLLIIMMLLRPQGLFGIKLERKKKKITPEEAPDVTLKD
jgi:branched-chain amino acid transport system permease protein